MMNIHTMTAEQVEEIRKKSRNKKRRSYHPGHLNHSMWEDQRLSFEQAIELSAHAINIYGPQYPHWCVSFSGGKDSTTVIALLAHLLDMGKVQEPESITVLYSDTRMELPSLSIAARQVLTSVAQRGWKTKIVEPPLADRFFVRMLGMGYPPPHSHLRYCTDLLKLKPMREAVRATYQELGQKFLTMTGYRLGESALRDQRIAAICDSKSGECGTGAILADVQTRAARAGLECDAGDGEPKWMFTRSPATQPMDVLCPIIPWRVCHITDVLAFHAPDWGVPTKHVLETYGWVGSGDSESLDGRTGCYCCPVAGNGDPVLRRLVKLGHWRYLEPLLQLRELYLELTKRKNRYTKTGERNADGKLSKRFNRDGPLTFPARLWGLDEVLRIQDEINERAECDGRPSLTIITLEEETEIRRLVMAETLPEKWSADDHLGIELFDRMEGETEDGHEIWQPVLGGMHL